ncbi:MAG: translation elongation factor-like protein [Thermoplasmata archaeon]
MEREHIGRVFNYYSKISVAAVQMTAGELRVGDEIVIEGPGGSLAMRVESMQIEHQPVEKVQAGQSVGLKVPGKVRQGDLVYRVKPAGPEPRP